MARTTTTAGKARTLKAVKPTPPTATTAGRVIPSVKALAEDSASTAPTREDIASAMMWIAQRTNRVPTLYGPTASGKTYLVHQLAKEHGAEVVTVLLGQHTPDEITGFQMPGKDNQLVAQHSYWMRQAQEILNSGKKVFILFDELNAAREEVRGAIYTFLRDRHLHGDHSLDRPDVLVFAAMNPAMLAAPYRSRCCFFHVPADATYLTGMAKNSLATFAAVHGEISKEGSDSAYSNAAPPPPETVDASAIAALNAIDTSFWTDLSPAARGLVITSLVPPALAKAMLEDNQAIDASELAKDVEMLFETLRSLPVPETMTLIAQLMSSYGTMNDGERENAHAAVLDAVYGDGTRDGLALLESYYFGRTDEMRAAISHIKAEPMVKALAERGMAIDEDGSTPKGTIFERLDAYVELTKDE